VSRVGSGKGGRAERESGVRGRVAKGMLRAEARWRSSRAVMTQSTSRMAGVVASWVAGSQAAEVSSLRLASSFLSKHGMIARCQILSSGTPYFWLRTDLMSVPARACGDFRRERCGRM